MVGGFPVKPPLKGVMRLAVASAISITCVVKETCYVINDGLDDKRRIIEKLNSTVDEYK
jgi:hypothetical protein